MKKLNILRIYSLFALGLSLLWLSVWLIPLPESINPDNTLRLLILIALSSTFLVSGLLGFVISKELRRLGSALVFASICHLIAWGAQDHLAPLPLVISFLAVINRSYREI